MQFAIMNTVKNLSVRCNKREENIKEDNLTELYFQTNILKIDLDKLLNSFAISGLTKQHHLRWKNKIAIKVIKKNLIYIITADIAFIVMAKALKIIIFAVDCEYRLIPRYSFSTEFLVKTICLNVSCSHFLYFFSEL